MSEIIENEVQEVERALTNVATSPLQDIYDIEELERRSILTTPADVPVFSFLRGSATKSINRTFEWDEIATNNTTLTDGKYGGYTPPSDNQGSPARLSNNLMAYGQVARVSNFAQALEYVDGTALNLELQQKYNRLVRGIEYYFWNGDKTGGDETDGIVTLVTNSVANGGGALVETVLQQAIVNVFENGGTVTHIFARPTVCQRIANFVQNRVHYNDNRGDGGISKRAFTYLSPFGVDIMVVPVRPEFIPSGAVYCLDMEYLKMRYAGSSVLMNTDLGEINDGKATLLKSYFGLELKAKNLYHIKITGVANSL